MLDLSQANAALFGALSAFQGDVENAAKSSSNPHFKSKYADLAEILNTIREPLAKHGLALYQTPSYDGERAHVHTVLAHKDGGSITSVSSCVPAKSDAQGIGAATTYLRRYSAAAVTGIAQEDDDGNSAMHDKKPAPIGEKLQAWINEVMEAPTLEELDRIGVANGAKALNTKDRDAIRAAYSKRKAQLSTPAKETA